MTGPIPPLGKVERRTGDRREARADRREGINTPARDLTVTDQPVIDETPPARHAPAQADASSAAFAAQVLGQSGQRRGLKGGAPVLDAARATYLGAEYSGVKERRPAKGAKGDAEV